MVLGKYSYLMLYQKSIQMRVKNSAGNGYSRHSPLRFAQNDNGFLMLLSWRATLLLIRLQQFLPFYQIGKKYFIVRSGSRNRHIINVRSMAP